MTTAKKHRELCKRLYNMNLTIKEYHISEAGKKIEYIKTIE